MSEKKLSVEEQLKKIDEVIARLEKEDLPLEDALKAFEEGIGLVKETNETLTDAEKRLKMLTEEGTADEL